MLALYLRDMNFAYLHLVVNHVPIVGFGFAVAIYFAGLFLRKPDIERTGLVAFVVCALAAAAAFYTGEPAEEIAEGIPGVSETSIEEHEEWAERAYALAAVTGVLAALAWTGAVRHPSLKVGLGAAAVATTVACGITGKAGGEIRHTEFSSAPAYPAGEAHGDDHDH